MLGRWARIYTDLEDSDCVTVWRTAGIVQVAQFWWRGGCGWNSGTKVGVEFVALARESGRAPWLIASPTS